MWLTAQELANELHCGVTKVNDLRKKRLLTYVNLGTTTHPQFRYQMPAPTPAEITPPIEKIALLTCQEVAEILGGSLDSVRWLVKYKSIHAVLIGKRAMVTVQELRRYLAKRDRRRGQKKQSYSPILMKWLKGYLESKEVQAEILDELIKTASLRAPVEKRSGYITKLWDLFDQVNRLLKELEDSTAKTP